jgi:hypothetical protein
MSSAQRLEKLGLLELKKQQAFALAVEIHGLREQVNAATASHRPIGELRLDELSVLMQRLQEKTTEHRQLCDDLRELAEDLNVQMPTTDVRRKR